jgi:RNA polymerase sigma-70 factor, ECF subfamily
MIRVITDNGLMSPADPSDSVLVGRVAQRDESAMAGIYQRYGSAVFSLAARILADRSLAEDITQDIFMQLWNEPTKFDPTRGKLRTLLLTRTHGRCVDIIRSRNAQTARESKVADDRSYHAHDAIDAELTAMSDAERVRGAIDTLQVGEREVLNLAYFGANTYREVATILNLPEGTVKTRMRSALQRLRVELNDHFFEVAPERTQSERTQSERTQAGQ